MNTSEKLGMTGLVIGGAAICFSIAQSIRLTKISRFVRDGVERTASNIDVNVSDSIIAEAVDIAVRREVDRSTRRVAADVTAELRTEIKNKVRIAVSDAFASVKGSVSDETKRQVAKLDISELRTEVKEEAKEKILAKFDGDLDDILTEFNQNLANVQKIYTSIAENISKK